MNQQLILFCKKKIKATTWNEFSIFIFMFLLVRINKRYFMCLVRNFLRFGHIEKQILSRTQTFSGIIKFMIKSNNFRRLKFNLIFGLNFIQIKSKFYNNNNFSIDWKLYVFIVFYQLKYLTDKSSNKKLRIFCFDFLNIVLNFSLNFKR